MHIKQNPAQIIYIHAMTIIRINGNGASIPQEVNESYTIKFIPISNIKNNLSLLRII